MAEVEIILIRHGEAASSWGDDPDPGLSNLGKSQAEAVKENLESFSNPRNTASGSLKMLDSSDVARRPLDCYLYHVIGEKLPSNLHYDNLQPVSYTHLTLPTNREV